MKAFADFLEAFVIGAVTRVENAAALVLEEEPAEASFFRSAACGQAPGSTTLARTVTPRTMKRGNLRIFIPPL